MKVVGWKGRHVKLGKTSKWPWGMQRYVKSLKRVIVSPRMIIHRGRG